MPIAKNCCSCGPLAPDSRADLLDEPAGSPRARPRGSPGPSTPRRAASGSAAARGRRASRGRRCPIDSSRSAGVSPTAAAAKVSWMRCAAELRAGDEELLLGAEEAEQVGVRDAGALARSPRSRCRAARRSANSLQRRGQQLGAALLRGAARAGHAHRSILGRPRRCQRAWTGGLYRPRAHRPGASLTAGGASASPSGLLGQLAPDLDRDLLDRQ